MLGPGQRMNAAVNLSYVAFAVVATLAGALHWLGRRHWRSLMATQVSRLDARLDGATRDALTLLTGHGAETTPNPPGMLRALAAVPVRERRSLRCAWMAKAINAEAKKVAAYATVFAARAARCPAQPANLAELANLSLLAPEEVANEAPFRELVARLRQVLYAWDETAEALTDESDRLGAALAAWEATAKALADKAERLRLPWWPDAEVTPPDSDHGPPPGRLVAARPAAPHGPPLVVASDNRVTTAVAA